MEADLSVAGVPLPPKDLLFMDPSAVAGLAHARQIIGKIKRYADLDGPFLDIGCGWGRSAYGLLDDGFKGSYVGFDIQPKHIEWLRANFSSSQPSYRFEKAHVPGSFAANDVGSVAFKISNILKAPVHTAIAMSVFTHVYEATVLDYTKQVFRLLGCGQAFIFSVFLLNQEARSLIENGKGYYKVRHKQNDHCFYDDPQIPKKVIAYDEDWLFAELRSQGYETPLVSYGSWCGRDSHAHPEGQDWVIARKPASAMSWWRRL